MIIKGDCLVKLKELEDNSVDSIVTDPPYELGFMGKSWDNTGIANNVKMWKECLRVLKPGGHLLSFGGTRTYHRMASAIEDAGFEVRDMIEWVYGSGFPKSLNIGKAVDKLQGNEREVVGEQKLQGTARRMKGGNYNDFQGEDTADIVNITKGTSEWEGWGTALKPAHEPICMARKPLAEKTVAENVLKYGTGGINIDESRVGTEERFNPSNHNKGNIAVTWTGGDETDDRSCVGRFPANLIHDNSEEVRECFPETKSGRAGKDGHKRKESLNYESNVNYADRSENAGELYGDSGNASRFFKSIIYQAKASKSERNKGCEGLEDKPKVFNGKSNKPSIDMKDVEKRFTTLPKANNHPTVKPITLMSYLIKMVTPKGGIVLDPFAGSGSTLVAAKQNGFDFIGIELTEEYILIIEARLNAVEPKQEELI